MTDEITGQPPAGEVLPQNTAPQPKNDAEAAQIEQQDAKAKAEADEKAAKTATEQDEKKRNRTKEYIQRLNSDNADMRRRLAELESQQNRQQQPAQQRQPQARSDAPPAIEDYNYDLAAWTEANNAYNRQQWTKEQQQLATQRQQQETMQRYAERANAFAEQHPDFEEVVGSIDPAFLSNDLQAEIMAHEKGAEIAYHLANNEDDLWNLASVQPHLLPHALQRLSQRLSAASNAQPQQPATPLPPQQPLQTKPISSAPKPVPTVGGRSPTEVPVEKMTDDQWYQHDRERRRKR